MSKTTVGNLQAGHSKEISELTAIIANACGTSSEEASSSIENKLGPIVLRFQRFRENGLDEIFEEAATNLQKAAALAEQALPAFQELNSKHISALKKLLVFADGYDENAGIEAIISRFAYVSRDLALWGQALAIATKTKPKKRGRGKPPLPTASATLELVDAWKSITGRPVVTPNTKALIGKRKKKEQSTKEPSTRFIELSLQMIFSDLTAANAQTSIRNALTTRQRFAAVLDDSDSTDEGVLLQRKIVSKYAEIRSKKT